MNEIKTISKNRKYFYICLYAFFIYIYYRIPLIQDAWVGGRFYSAQENFFGAIKCALPLYNTLNGRLFAEVIVAFFERNECVLDVTNSIIFTLIIFFLEKIHKKNYLFGGIVSTILILSVGKGIRTEVYFYATMIYLVPFLLLVLFLILLDMGPQYDNREKAIFLALGMLNSGWLENTGFGFLIAYYMWGVINRKNNKLIYYIGAIINSITFFIMMKSPGLSANRTIYNPEISLYELIQSNLALVIKTLLVDQWIITVFVLVMFIFILSKNKNKFAKGLIIFNMMLMLILVLNIVACWIGFNIPNCISLSNRIVTIPFGICFLIILFGEIIFAGQTKIIFPFIAGVASLAPCIITPNFGYRICHFASMMIIVIALYGLSCLEFEYSEKSYKYVITLLAILLIIMIDTYSLVVERINVIQKKRESIIDEVVIRQRMGEWDYDKTVVLPLFSDDLYVQASPNKNIDPVHYDCFLSFYDLNKDTLILFSDSPDVLDVKINENKVHMEANIIGSQKIPVSYYIENNGVVQDESISDNFSGANFDIDNLSGDIKFFCTYNDGLTDIQLYSVKVLTR